MHETVTQVTSIMYFMEVALKFVKLEPFVQNRNMDAWPNLAFFILVCMSSLCKDIHLLGFQHLILFI